MALDLLFQQALREVVEEIKGYSKEEFELKLADSKKSSFALTIDSLMGFQSESFMCFDELIIPNTHNFLALLKNISVQLIFTIVSSNLQQMTINIY